MPTCEIITIHDLETPRKLTKTHHNNVGKPLLSVFDHLKHIKTPFYGDEKSIYITGFGLHRSRYIQDKLTERSPNLGRGPGLPVQACALQGGRPQWVGCLGICWEVYQWDALNAANPVFWQVSSKDRPKKQLVGLFTTTKNKYPEPRASPLCHQFHCPYYLMAKVLNVNWIKVPGMIWQNIVLKLKSHSRTFED